MKIVKVITEGINSVNQVVCTSTRELEGDSQIFYDDRDNVFRYVGFIIKDHISMKPKNLNPYNFIVSVYLSNGDKYIQVYLASSFGIYS